MRERFSNALLVLVPRHPPRFAEVAASLQAQGVPFVTRTSGGAYRRTPQVFLVDTLGELPAFYAAGDVAFVGGSLVPIGGHNLLEPAALGLPIAGGAPQFQFRGHRATCWWSAARCASCRTRRSWRRSSVSLLADPTARTNMGASGRKAVDDNRGAVARLMQFLEPLLP